MLPSTQGFAQPRQQEHSRGDPKTSTNWSSICSTGTSRDGCSIAPGCCTLPTLPRALAAHPGWVAAPQQQATHQPPTRRRTLCLPRRIPCPVRLLFWQGCVRHVPCTSRSRVVHGFGQGHLDRQLLVAPERAQSALPPPRGRTSSVAFSHED